MNYIMGEAAGVGTLTYTITESEWKSSLDGSLGQRLPKHRFLILQVSVNNRGAEDVNLPLLSLIDSSGAAHREESQADGISPWLGLLRRLGPAETMTGKILFDVPQGAYNLRVSSGGDADAETTALVEIPYRAEAPPVKAIDAIPAAPAQ